MFIPKFLVIEIFKHKEKILNYSKLDEDEVLESFYSVLKYCRIFDDNDIPAAVEAKAAALVEDVDPRDVVFVAAALTLDAVLWIKKHTPRIKKKKFLTFKLSYVMKGGAINCKRIVW